MHILRMETQMKGRIGDRGRSLIQIEGPNPKERPNPIITAPRKVSLTHCERREAISRLLRRVSAIPSPPRALEMAAIKSIVKGVLRKNTK